MKINMDSLLFKTNKQTNNQTHERISLFFCWYELNSSSCDLSAVVFALYSHIWHETQVTYCYFSHTQRNKVKIYHSFEPLVKSLRDVLKKCHHQGVGPIIPSANPKVSCQWSPSSDKPLEWMTHPKTASTLRQPPLMKHNLLSVPIGRRADGGPKTWVDVCVWHTWF